MLILVTGGARSGKSVAAERFAASVGRPVTVVATAEAEDEEMAARIAAHQADRPDTWELIEEPVNVLAAIDSVDDTATIIVDCLTMWAANRLDETDDEILDAAEATARAASAREGRTIVVTNEVGDGIVPVNDIARRYRDTLGRVNQTFAAHANRAVLMVAGRCVELTPIEQLDV